MTVQDFRTKLEPFLLGKNPTEKRKTHVKGFLLLCTYHAGQYDSSKDTARVSKDIQKVGFVFWYLYYLLICLYLYK
jgi:hypothetical protein